VASRVFGSRVPQCITRLDVRSAARLHLRRLPRDRALLLRGLLLALALVVVVLYLALLTTTELVGRRLLRRRLPLALLDGAQALALQGPRAVEVVVARRGQRPLLDVALGDLEGPAAHVVVVTGGGLLALADARRQVERARPAHDDVVGGRGPPRADVVVAEHAPGPHGPPVARSTSGRSGRWMTRVSGNTVTLRAGGSATTTMSGAKNEASGTITQPHGP
jgi:hypothetical protein